MHEGIDTNQVKPNPNASLTLNRAGKLTSKDEILTFVNRSLEPYRGFHAFMRSLPKIMRDRPKVRVIIIGGDGITYGRMPENGKNWREVMLREVGGKLDMSRIHFLGRVPYDNFLSIIQISTAHVYFTYPLFCLGHPLVMVQVAC